MAKKTSAFDQVFATCQEEYAETAAKANSRQDWQPPDNWKGTIALGKASKESGSNDKGDYHILKVPFTVLDGDLEGRKFTRSIFLPKGAFEMASLANCLAGEVIEDARKACDLIMESEGAVIAAAAREKDHNGKTYTNVYYNKKVG